MLLACLLANQLQVAFYSIVIKHVLAEQSKIYADLKDLSVHPDGKVPTRSLLCHGDPFFIRHGTFVSSGVNTKASPLRPQY